MFFFFIIIINSARTPDFIEIIGWHENGSHTHEGTYDQGFSGRPRCLASDGAIPQDTDEGGSAADILEAGIMGGGGGRKEAGTVRGGGWGGTPHSPGDLESPDEGECPLDAVLIFGFLGPLSSCTAATKGRRLITR